ncbi:hypothetical protein NHQ30_005390 [Ciborinia camelliae]|nr:hypothetical protein NHQ30_005390 [Ciborinia camelliae]
MTGRQGTPRPPTSTFIELRPRARHTISSPPLSLAFTVSDSSKAIVTPHASLPHAHVHASLPLPQTPARTTSTITAIRPTQKSSDPSFICTICWSPQHPPSTPRVLGRSSRIVCHQCWRAVLDLSICWVCGECIVRGDDVVSLGWCFWHRGCFGCLLCGVRLGEKFLVNCESERDERDDGGNGRKGTELDKIPLCEWCETETKIKGYGEKKVLERGLKNVSKSDGGLTMCRLEKLDEDKGLGVSLGLSGKKNVVVGLDGEEMESSAPASSSSDISPLSINKRPTRSTMVNERKIRKIIRDSSTPQEEIALVQDAAKMGVSEDENPDDSTHSHSDTELADFGQPGTSSSTSPSDVYVSIYDPAGRAFVPSKTKPLPKWMSLLPNNVHRERGDSRDDLSQRKAGAAVSRATLPHAYADGASSNHSEDCMGEHSPHTPCPIEEGGTEVSTREHSGIVTPRNQLHLRDRANSASDTTSNSTRRPSTDQSTVPSLVALTPKAKQSTTRPRSVSIEEKLPRPHQQPASAYRRSNRSSTIGSSSIKSGNLTIQAGQLLEHPPRDVSERPLTPYPEREDAFQAIVVESGKGRAEAEGTSMLASPPNNFTKPRKDSCCGLSTSLENPGMDGLEKRDRAESSFDNTFESFPKPEIGAGIASPKLGFLGQSSEYLESLGQVAQSVKEEKERKRAESQSQSDWDWMEGEGKSQNGEEGKSQIISGRSSLKGSRRRGVNEEERGQWERTASRTESRSGSRRSARRSRASEEERGQLTRTGSKKGSRKGKEREMRDVKGKGKLVEREEEEEAGFDEKREKLKKELRTLFGEE